jgi:glutathionylspermidine synthase
MYAVIDDEPYWDESAYYAFSLDEVLALEAAVVSLHEMCMAAVAHVIERDRFLEYGITDPRVIQLITSSWASRGVLEDGLYGRFDLWYDGSGPPKLLEYNADTPTALLEAAGPQWFWLEQLHPGLDQWNSLHERLIAAWQRLSPTLKGPVHFAHTEADEIGEDYMTAAYMQECAEQAGLHGVALTVESIGWDPAGRFVDEHDREIGTIFKLYPWEWLVSDRFGSRLLDLALSGRGPLWIEPPWKMLLSNKALLAVLWDLYPGHSLLLPAYLEGPRELAIHGYAAKPLLGREGAGIHIVTPGFELGAPGTGPVCYQAFQPLPVFGGKRPVLGAWVVDGEPAGLGIRETPGLITDLTATFVPHLVYT